MNTMINGADAADENANRVGFSKDGFWMTFGRELSPKYTRYEESKSGAGGAPKWNRPDLDQPNAWRVVGYYDFLRIKKINALDGSKLAVGRFPTHRIILPGYRPATLC